MLTSCKQMVEHCAFQAWEAGSIPAHDTMRTRCKKAEYSFRKGYKVSPDGGVIGVRGKPLVLYESGGYQKFSFRHQGVRTVVAVHALAAYQKFGDQVHECEHIRHLDGNPLNNKLENIGLGSQSDNRLDVDPAVRRRTAIQASQSLLRPDWEQVDKARASGASYKQLEQKFGVPRSSCCYRYSTTAKRTRTTDR